MSNLMIRLAVFFLLILSTSFSLKCIRQDEPLYEIIFNYKYENFLKKLKDLPSNIRTRCRTKLSIESQPTQLTIYFSKILSMSNLSDYNVQVNTFIHYDTITSTSLFTTLEYACSGPDNCERQFVLDHIGWFVRENDLKLQITTAWLLQVAANNPGMYHQHY
jgi:hypothetical protein